jgi:hypothetical protein
MTTLTHCAERTTLSGAFRGAEPRLMEEHGRLAGWGLVEPLSVPAIAESAEAVIEDLDAPMAAAPAVMDGLAGTRPGPAPPLIVRVRRRHDTRAPIDGGPGDDADLAQGRAIAIDEYAKAVLYNGLRHYHAARAAAQRACEHDDFVLLEGALAELVEAGARSGHRS